MIRKPAVAGYFYPAEERELRLLIEELFSCEDGPRGKEEELGKWKEISGVVSPHAGYIYSGVVACWSFLFSFSGLSGRYHSHNWSQSSRSG